jgi:hypothetical protein
MIKRQTIPNSSKLFTLEPKNNNTINMTNPVAKRLMNKADFMANL